MPQTIEERRARTRAATEHRLAQQKARVTDPDVAEAWIAEQIRKAPPLSDRQIVRIARLLTEHAQDVA